MAKRKEGKSSRTSVLDIMNTDSSSFQGVDFDDAIKDLDKLKNRGGEKISDINENQSSKEIIQNKTDVVREEEKKETAKKVISENTSKSDPKNKESDTFGKSLDKVSSSITENKSLKEIRKLYEVKDHEGKSVSFNYTMNAEVLKKLQKLEALYNIKTDDHAPRKHHLMRKLAEDFISKNYEKMLKDLL